MTHNRYDQFMRLRYPLPVNKRLDADQRHDLLLDVVELYHDGHRIRHIMWLTGRSYGTIHRILHLAQDQGMLTIKSVGHPRGRQP